MIKNKLAGILIFLAIASITLGINAFPNYYASTQASEGKIFSGQASWFDPWDINVYVSAIRWGQGKNILLTNNYTTAEHTPVLMYPLYTLSGYFLPTFSPYLTFHLLAMFFGFLLLLTVWKLVKVFLPGKNESLIATFLIALGGGIGWLFFPGLQSADLFITGFTFTSHFQRPHEALGILLYLLSLVFFYRAAISKKLHFSLLSLGALLPLMLFYPYYFLSYVLICGLYSLVILLKENGKKPLIYAFINSSLVIPFILIYQSHLKGSEGFASVISQQLSNPGIFNLALGYGILSVFLIYQAIYLKKDRTTVFLNIWFFTSLLLSFLPFGFSRFYLRTLFFPAVLLTILSLGLLSAKIKISKNFFLIGLLILLPISTCYMTYKRITEATNNNHWYYITKAEKEALIFLQTQTPKGSSVLSAYTMGNMIPANTDNKVYFGHLLQTPNSQEKINNLVRFYSNSFSEDEGLNFLQKEGIRYIIFGAEEANITTANSKSKELKYQFLKPVFKEGSTTIFAY